jgi:hypothetical protein
MSIESFPVCDPCDYNLFQTALTDELCQEEQTVSMVYTSVCGPGGGGCVSAMLFSPLDSEERAFHPTELREATEAINEILETLRNNAPEGKELSFLRIPGGGAMLAWMEQGVEIPPDAVTPNSPQEEIKQALGLVMPAAAY